MSKNQNSKIIIAMDAVMVILSLAFGYVGGTVATHFGFDRLLGMLGAAYLPFFANKAIKRVIFVDSVPSEGKETKGIDKRGLD